MNNPFKLAEPVAKKLKILLYGQAGTGKTIAALTFPKCAYIDAEGGADLYAGRPGIEPFHILRTKGLTELERAIAFIEWDKGNTFETLIIDPITVFYDVEKQALAKQNGSMDMQGWTRLNNRMKAVYNRLTNLPVHVIVIAREAIEYAGEGLNLRKDGYKADADKALPYLFDFTIRMMPDHSGVIDKSRGYQFGDNGQLKQVNWSIFEPVANQFTSGVRIEQQSEDDASDHEIKLMKHRHNAESFYKRWNGKDLPDPGGGVIDDGWMLRTLGVDKLSQFAGTIDDANSKMQVAIDAMSKPTSGFDIVGWCESRPTVTIEKIVPDKQKQGMESRWLAWIPSPDLKNGQKIPVTFWKEDVDTICNILKLECKRNQSLTFDPPLPVIVCWRENYQVCFEGTVSSFSNPSVEIRFYDLYFERLTVAQMLDALDVQVLSTYRGTIHDAIKLADAYLEDMADGQEQIALQDMEEEPLTMESKSPAEGLGTRNSIYEILKNGATAYETVENLGDKVNSDAIPD